MLNRLIYLLFVTSIVFVIGCENQSDSSSSSPTPGSTAPNDTSYLNHAVATIKYMVESNESDIKTKFITEDHKCLAIRTDTLVMIQDEDLDDFEFKAWSDIRENNRVQYYFYSTNVNYNVNPAEYRLEKIVVFNPNNTNNIDIIEF